MKLEEIARLAGVSSTTASYVINGKAKKHRVSDKTVEKVLAVVKQYNYQPNAVAAGLKRGRTNTIGLIIPDLENRSYARIAHFLELFARQMGYQLLVACSEDNPEIEKQCVFLLKKRRIDALIISSSMTTDYSFYRGWNNNDVPVIALDRPLPESDFKSVIGADFDDSKRLAFALQQHCHDDVVYFGALPELSVSKQRHDGFLSVFGEANKQDCDHKNHIRYLLADNYSRDNAYHLCREWLEHNTLPKAFFVTSFALSCGIVDAIFEKYRELPSELILATFGSNEFLNFLPCRMLTLAQDHEKVAQITLNKVLNFLDNDAPYQPGISQVNRILSSKGL